MPGTCGEVIGVLVDGQLWHYYDLSRTGLFAKKYMGTTDIVNEPIQTSARTLTATIGKQAWW